MIGRNKDMKENVPEFIEEEITKPYHRHDPGPWVTHPDDRPTLRLRIPQTESKEKSK
jgi:hypothetical protein